MIDTETGVAAFFTGEPGPGRLMGILEGQCRAPIRSPPDQRTTRQTCAISLSQNDCVALVRPSAPPPEFRLRLADPWPFVCDLGRAFRAVRFEAVAPGACGRLSPQRASMRRSCSCWPSSSDVAASWSTSQSAVHSASRLLPAGAAGL
jgi:hypothetical protein